MKLIDKSTLVAEIERRINSWTIRSEHSSEGQGKDTCTSRVTELNDLLSFLDTLEVKELHEDIDVDLNPFFEEMGVEPDSRIASIFKGAFYKCIDKYLKAKGE